MFRRFCVWCLLPNWVRVRASRYTSSVYACKRDDAKSGRARARAETEFMVRDGRCRP